MSKESKKEKFFCITNCLPVKSKATKNKKNGSRQPFKNENDDPECTSVDDGSSVVDKMNHTRQWLHNVNANTDFRADSGQEDFRAPNPVEDRRRKGTSRDNSAGRRQDSSNDSTSKPRLDLSASSDATLRDHPEANESALTSVSRHQTKRHRISKRKIPGRQDADDASVASSCVSLATERVVVNLEGNKSLGITIVGHFNSRQGDCGIFVGCVSKDGAAAETGKIEPGDLITEVNGIDLDNLPNDSALDVLRREIARRGTLILVLAKYWDLNEQESDVMVTNYDENFRTSFIAPREPGLPGRPLEEERSTRRRRPGDYNYDCYNYRPLDRRVDFPQRPPSSYMPPMFYYQPVYGLPGYLDLGYPEPARKLPMPAPVSLRLAIPPGMPILGSELVTWIQMNVPRMSNRSEAHEYARLLVEMGFLAGNNGSGFHESGRFFVQSQGPLPSFY